MARPAKIREVKYLNLTPGSNRMTYCVHIQVEGDTKIGKINARTEMSIDHAAGLVISLKRAIKEVKDEVNRVAALAGV